MEHYACLHLAVYRRRDRDGVSRIAVEKIGGPVDRIHDPHQPAYDQLRGKLLAHQHCAGIGLPEHPGDDLLSPAVDFGNEIVGALGLPRRGIAGTLDRAQVLHSSFGGARRDSQ